jgi:tetratricopeptide (TPR) repeat protein
MDAALTRTYEHQPMNRTRRRLWKLFGWLAQHAGVLLLWLGLVGTAAGQWTPQRPSYLLPQEEPIPVPTKDKAFSLPAKEKSIPIRAKDQSIPAHAQDESIPRRAQDESIPRRAQDEFVPLLAEAKGVPPAPGLGTSAMASAEASSDVPEAPWVPPISASAGPVTEPSAQHQDTLSPDPGKTSGILPSGRSSDADSGQGDEVFSDKQQPTWTPFSGPSPVVAHQAGPPGDQAEESGPSSPGRPYQEAHGLPPVRLEAKLIPIEAFSRNAWPESGRPPKPVCPPDAISHQESLCQQEPLSQQDPLCPPERSRQLERIARQAKEHIGRAVELAGRGAYFSARAEFLSALELIAQGLDQQHRTRRHGQALARGLTALEEADDFLPASGGMGQIRDLRAIVAGHTTPVLQGHPVEMLTPMEALQRYLTYAQEQLAVAVGQEAAGSAALYGLGKLYAALGDQPALSLKAAQPKAMVFYQAALLVDPRNYRAANDLGVLLARSGWYEEARAALSYSLRLHSDPVVWRNLAIVYRQMGQYELALQAAQQWRLLRQHSEASLAWPGQTADFFVQWVPPEQFAAPENQPPAESPPALPGLPNRAPARSAASSGLPSPPEISPSRAAPSRFEHNSAWKTFGGDPAEPRPSQSKPSPFWKSLLAGPLAIFPRPAGSGTPSGAPSGMGNGGPVENSSSALGPTANRPSPLPSRMEPFR